MADDFYSATLNYSAVLAVALCLSVFVTSRSSTETAERIELVFGTGATCSLKGGS